jgi:hypothetical protein
MNELREVVARTAGGVPGIGDRSRSVPRTIGPAELVAFVERGRSFLEYEPVTAIAGRR